MSFEEFTIKCKTVELLYKTSNQQQQQQQHDAYVNKTIISYKTMNISNM